MYNVGTRVRLKGINVHGHDFNGITGTVHHYLDSDDWILIKTDKPNIFEQRATYDCPANFAVWIRNEEIGDYIEVIDDSQQSSASFKLKPYEAGQSIDEYVDYLLSFDDFGKERLKWLNAFKNCVLPPKVKSLIEEALTVILQKDKFDEWGINEHFEKGLTNSILLYGPPGVGKSMVSESIAAVLGKNLMKIDNGLLQSNIPGETERNIQKAFAEAKQKNCVLMFDECDSVLSNRDMVGVILSSEINALLTAIENYDGVVVLSTNRLHRLDPALSRRIIAKIELTLPTKEARHQIWQNLIPKKMPIEELDYALLASHELSGGEIKNAILLSARKAICANLDKVTMEHFNLAIESVVESSHQFENAQPKHLSPMVYAQEHGVKTNGHMTKRMDKYVSKMGAHA